MSLAQRVLKISTVAAAVLSIAAISGSASGVLAQSTPPVARVFGSITFNGSTNLNWATVTAYSGSTTCGTGSPDGRYVDIDSSNPACNRVGTVITFKVGSQWANQTFVIPDLPGSAQQVNLTGPAASQPGGGGAATSSATYSPGWNLAGGPAGTLFSQAAGVLYTFPAGASAYTQVPNTQPAQAGVGYWAFFNSQTTVTLSGNTTLPFTVTAPAGQYIMIANPSATSTVTVSGADVVYTYDPTNAASPYSAVSTLQPGQGAWVYSAAGGTITMQ